MEAKSVIAEQSILRARDNLQVTQNNSELLMNRADVWMTKNAVDIDKVKAEYKAVLERNAQNLRSFVDSCVEKMGGAKAFLLSSFPAHIAHPVSRLFDYALQQKMPFVAVGQ